jgi:hypothetical protein
VGKLQGFEVHPELVGDGFRSVAHSDLRPGSYRRPVWPEGSEATSVPQA